MAGLGFVGGTALVVEGLLGAVSMLILTEVAFGQLASGVAFTVGLEAKTSKDLLRSSFCPQPSQKRASGRF